MIYIIINNNIYSNTLLDIQALSETIQPYLNEIRAEYGIKFCEEYKIFLYNLKRLNMDEFLKVIGCRAEDLILSCKNGHGFRVMNKCNSKYCPYCSNARSTKYKRIFKSFLESSPERLPLRFVTLTWANTWNLDMNIRKKYYNHFMALKKRLKRYGYNIIKGVKSFEVKYNEKTGWNCHLHLLIYAKYITNKRYIHLRKNFSRNGETNGYIKRSFLSKIWKEITTNSYVCDTKVIKKGIRGGVNYLCKYITKDDNLYNLKFNKLVEINDFKKNLRVIDKFGFKRNERLTDHKLICVCPVCSSMVSFDPHQWIEDYRNEALKVIPKIEYDGG